MKQERAVTAGPSPLLGEHTEAVLRRGLGLDAAAVARLGADGIRR